MEDSGKLTSDITVTGLPHWMYKRVRKREGGEREGGRKRENGSADNCTNRTLQPPLTAWPV